jgi:hypothetical protein
MGTSHIQITAHLQMPGLGELLGMRGWTFRQKGWQGSGMSLGLLAWRCFNSGEDNGVPHGRDYRGVA